MHSRTLIVTIRRPADEVYAFTSNPENLPTWAPGLCQSVERQGDHWLVQTKQGPMRLRYAEPNDFGVLDHTVTTSDGQQVYVPMRVIANGNGSLVLFTLFQLPGMTDEQFAADQRMVEADLHRLRIAMER